jgi:hypothetical protein
MKLYPSSLLQYVIGFIYIELGRESLTSKPETILLQIKELENKNHSNIHSSQTHSDLIQH